MSPHQPTNQPWMQSSITTNLMHIAITMHFMLVILNQLKSHPITCIKIVDYMIHPRVFVFCFSRDDMIHPYVLSNECLILLGRIWPFVDLLILAPPMFLVWLFNTMGHPYLHFDTSRVSNSHDVATDYM